MVGLAALFVERQVQTAALNEKVTDQRTDKGAKVVISATPSEAEPECSMALLPFKDFKR
jgi:peroxiredoxin